MALQAGPDGKYGIFWVGADGNLWMQGNDRVVRKGAAATPGTLSAARNVYREVADPNPPRQQQTQATPSYSGGYSGGSGARYSAASTSKPLDQAAVSNTQRALDELPGLLSAALASENQSYRNTLGGYDQQEKQQRDTYNKSSETNQLNYDRNYMESLRAGVRGLSNLLGILRGSGGIGGSVQDDVQDVVAGVTADDIRQGAVTRDENQSNLDNSLSTFLGELKQKRQKAADTHTNNEAAIRRDNATQQQDLLSKLAGYYGDAGMTAQRNDYMTRAGNLTPAIAQASRTQTSAYDTSPVKVDAPELSAFAEVSQPNSEIVAPSDGQIGAGVFSMRRANTRRKEA